MKIFKTYKFPVGSIIIDPHRYIPENENIMICIAMGYPDPDFAANDVRSTRIANESFVNYLGFD